jgi:hypothetical protein
MRYETRAIARRDRVLRAMMAQALAEREMFFATEREQGTSSLAKRTKLLCTESKARGDRASLGRRLPSPDWSQSRLWINDTSLHDLRINTAQSVA